MTRFWLATFKTAPYTAGTAGPYADTRSDKLAIEVLFDDDTGVLAVLLSTADDLETPTSLHCVIGFTNGARACNDWHERGFPLIDAEIDYDANLGTVALRSSCFVADNTMHYDQPICSITGVNFTQMSSAAMSIDYQQQMQTPDSAQPASFVIQQCVKWTPRRQGNSTSSPASVSFAANPIRCPSLAPLNVPLTPQRVWSGHLVLSKFPKATQPRRLVQCNNIFGVPAFRFEEVETLGFRIDATEYGDDLTRHLPEIVAPLNFHRSRSGGRRPVLDFTYRGATHTLVIELLRYTRMKTRTPSPSLGVNDSQSQHELVVRVLVGRVDDDTSQARDPATFVPVLFVDNSWSKVLGRQTLGYDKRMADFWTGPVGGLDRLRPDGRPARTGSAGEPVPLRDVTRATLVERTGGPAGPPLMDFSYSFDPGSDPDVLELVDTGLALGASVLSTLRWRLSDFDTEEFARSFASLALFDKLRSFQSVQPAPVGIRGRQRNLQTWIPSVFAIEPEVGFSLPTGDASLTLHAAAEAPPIWNLLCRILGDGVKADVNLTMGNWYRILCSMDLTAEDQLDFRV